MASVNQPSPVRRANRRVRVGLNDNLCNRQEHTVVESEEKPEPEVGAHYSKGVIIIGYTVVIMRTTTIEACLIECEGVEECKSVADA